MSKKSGILVFVVCLFVGMIVASVFNFSNIFSSSDTEAAKDINNGEFLTGAPLLQPSDHEGRWEKGGSNYNACLVCHNESAANQYASDTTVPKNHFVDETTSKGVAPAREVCITCHPVIQK
ncbi:MAG TPA: nitrate reductase cytochrome c-type subunit [Firmicutes bacterium]|nr:nitrate reductase cytochrome c-type subunit [Bacillales bacterium]HJA41152.1 nitrate reductase cytochrome c-type subunit [Bacillota bacterium]